MTVRDKALSAFSKIRISLNSVDQKVQPGPFREVVSTTSVDSELVGLVEVQVLWSPSTVSLAQDIHQIRHNTKLQEGNWEK